MTSNIDSSTLQLSAVYESHNRFNMTACAFSVCGKYFAFAESPRVVAVYLTEQLREACFMQRPDTPTDSNEEFGGKPPPWRVPIPDSLTGESIPIKLEPLLRVTTEGTINCITFATGDVSRCRLPHRIGKRVSSVVQGSSITLMLVSLANGHTEVYNTAKFDPTVPIISYMVLYTMSLPIFKLTATTDGSLRVATVQLDGYVFLWDLWDDGNMYTGLKSNFLLPATSEWSRYASRGEACTFAWQPFGSHICLAGQRGNGVILHSEHPYQVLSVLRPGHSHRISDASYTHDGSLLVTVSYDSCSIVWSVPEYENLYRFWQTGQPLSRLMLGGINGLHLYGLAVAPDDLGFVTICEDRRVCLWPLVPTNTPSKSYLVALSEMGRTKLRSVAFSRCGKIIPVCTSDGRLFVFTTQSQLLSLSVQCLRVIRRCLLLHMRGMKSAVVSSARPRPEARKTTPTALALLTSLLPVPSKLVPIILGDLLWLHDCNRRSETP